MVNVKKAPQESKRVSFMSPKMIKNHHFAEDVSQTIYASQNVTKSEDLLITDENESESSKS